MAVSADLFLGGFDTHANHDPEHNWLLGNLTDSVDFLWEYAETHEVADRLVVVMGSDFGRTNHYNVDEGKDHWPIGSVIVMEKNQSWTNRVVGETDALHFAYKINPPGRCGVTTPTEPLSTRSTFTRRCVGTSGSRTRRAPSGFRSTTRRTSRSSNDFLDVPSTATRSPSQ